MHYKYFNQQHVTRFHQMSNSKHIDQDPIIKTKPTIFPLGFNLSMIENSLIIIDFMDVINKNNTIIESIALPEQKAQQLSQALLKIIKDGKFEE